MKRIFVTIFAIFWLGILPGKALTESELAAKNQTPANAQQIAGWKTACPIQLSNTIQVQPNIVEGFLEDQTFLIVIEFLRADTKRSEDQIRAFPELPHGGIAGKDFCGSVALFDLTKKPPAKPNEFIALRLRPGLDIAKNYPSAYAQIQKYRQIMRLKPGAYIARTVRSHEEASLIVKNHLDSPDVKNIGFAFRIDETLYIPKDASR